jgi:hypothetical protein
MNLTEHFTDNEMGVNGCENRIIQNAIYICKELLEPIRGKFGVINVHDGYRNPTHNANVGGKSASFHLFEDGKSAVDISADSVSIPVLFDWIRLASGLPFDKVIMELNDKNIPACVHLQLDRLNKPRREAFIGHTGAAKDYTSVSVN